MFHSKPWRRNYILDAIRGFPPGRTRLAFWEFADGPVRSFGRTELFMRKRAVALGRAISLLHSRSFRNI
jgi:hypothetical protein